MKILALTEQKAKDINLILRLCVAQGENTQCIVRQFDELETFSSSYIDHLLDILKQYNQSPKILDIEGWVLEAIYNTKPFLEDGGFIRLYKLEQRDEKIQDFTLRNLRQSIFATKDWWLLFIFTTLATVGVTKLTTSSKEEKTKEQAPTQDNTKPVTKTNPYHLDYSNSYNRRLKSDTIPKAK